MTSDSTKKCVFLVTRSDLILRRKTPLAVPPRGKIYSRAVEIQHDEGAVKTTKQQTGTPAREQKNTTLGEQSFLAGWEVR
jgi:hypothetical protein